MIEYEYAMRKGSITNKGFETILTDNGDREWYLDGKLHREDGPAIESGLSKNLWYLHGVRLFEPQIKTLKHILNSSHKELVLMIAIKPPLNTIVSQRLRNKNYRPSSIMIYPMHKFAQDMLSRDLY